MSKWKRRLDEILQRETQGYPDIEKLFNKIKNHLHGNTNINTLQTEIDINEICKNHTLDRSKIEKVIIMSNSKKVEENSMSLIIEIHISGNFEGIIHIETGAGYTTKNNIREPIYYIFSSDCRFESKGKDKIKKYLLSFKHDNAHKFIDLVFDRDDLFVDYGSKYQHYTVWDKKHELYEDIISGSNEEYNEDRYFAAYYEIHKNLEKLHKAQNIREFARNKLDGKREKVEWYEYSL